MLISHKHKFITIDIPKTGTTSINHSLLPLLGIEDIFSYPNFRLQKIQTQAKAIQDSMRHSTYSQILAKFLNVQNYFRFCFVRNPWDRILSFYLFKKHNAVNKIPQDMSFKDFLSLNLSEDFPCQYFYIDGFHDFSFVGRFENLQQDFNAVCDKIGIPQQQLPHKNKTNHKHYTEYYDDETREIVAEKYARDIESFGYKFRA